MRPNIKSLGVPLLLSRFQSSKPFGCLVAQAHWSRHMSLMSSFDFQPSTCTVAWMHPQRLPHLLSDTPFTFQAEVRAGLPDAGALCTEGAPHSRPRCAPSPAWRKTGK